MECDENFEIKYFEWRVLLLFERVLNVESLSI